MTFNSHTLTIHKHTFIFGYNETQYSLLFCHKITSYNPFALQINFLSFFFSIYTNFKNFLNKKIWRVNRVHCDKHLKGMNENEYFQKAKYINSISMLHSNEDIIPNCNLHILHIDMIDSCSYLSNIINMSVKCNYVSQFFKLSTNHEQSCSSYTSRTSYVYTKIRGSQTFSMQKKKSCSVYQNCWLPLSYQSLYMEQL